MASKERKAASKRRAQIAAAHRERLRAQRSAQAKKQIQERYRASEVTVTRDDGTTETHPPLSPQEMHAVQSSQPPRRKR